ncbi:MAG: penicillin-binding protein [Bacteroidetes bacterium]|nr:penicillin-binding protein [Bacteroidota bacterium]
MEPKEQIFARMYVVITLVSLLPILVAFQVMKISVLDGPQLREQVAVQSTSYQTLPPTRGVILDSKGRAMAINIEKYDIAVDPTANQFETDSEMFFEQFSEMSGQTVVALKGKVERSRSRMFTQLVRNATFSDRDIRLLEEYPFVIINRETRRKYTYGPTAAHVVGFMGTDNGLTGLEKEFDKELAGLSGQRTTKRDRKGVLRPIPGGLIQDPVHGISLVLTIDLNQQAILEEELERGVMESGANWGTAIAIDVKTGAVRAMANYPTFDLNSGVFATETQLRNHAISDMIEPGSTMKVLPAVAAIESGVVGMDTMIDTGVSGTIRLHGFDLSDTVPHGRISFSEVIKVSSNIGTAIVSEMTDKGEFYKHAVNLGFNQPTYIELPGEALSTRVLTIDKWSRSTHSGMSRGYGIEGTPLQIALAYAALANGGILKRPYIVQEKRDAQGNTIWTARPDSIRRAFKKETAATIMPAFESVVGVGGTAGQAAVPGLRVAGKTGTAKTARGGNYANRDYRATFVGFYPVEDPQIVLLVLMDAPRTSIYGGVVAAPVFKRTTERWLANMPEMTPFIHQDSLLTRLVPAGIPFQDVMSSGLPSRQVGALGLRTQKSASFVDYVTKQNVVLPGAKAEPGISVQTDSYKGILIPKAMPDLIGLSLRDAIAKLTKLGVKVEVTGHGMVESQWPEPGGELLQTATLSSK